MLYFEGDPHSAFRLVRAVKNRFGAVNELGVFAMTEKGLRGVANPSALFLSQHPRAVPGSCVLVTLEGTRPMLVEVQALVDAGGPSPRRLSVGLERDRLAMKPRGNALPRKLDWIASITARSAAGSLMRTPPTALTNTS